MEDKLHFELVSPERLLMDAEVNAVVVPGSEGDFMVLPRHGPMMTTIRPGVVQVTAEEGEATRLFIRGGFAEVTPKGLVILAEEAVDLADVSKSDLEGRLRDAEEDLEDAKTDEDQQVAAEAVKQLGQLLQALSS
jgi:F-type H+-transporting ATPase subunit epsilon